MSYVLLDRDGTLIHHKPYLCNPCDVEVLPTVIAGLAELVESGFKLFLHTNQSGIGRGYFLLSDAIACNDEMLRQIGLGCDLFEDICICPERPGQEMKFRKPSPNYGFSIIHKYGVDKNSLCYLGDNVTDLLAAKNIGCMGVGVDTGGHDLRAMLKDNGLDWYYPVFDRFIDAARYIIDCSNHEK